MDAAHLGGMVHDMIQGGEEQRVRYSVTLLCKVISTSELCKFMWIVNVNRKHEQIGSVIRYRHSNLPY